MSFIFKLFKKSLIKKHKTVEKKNVYKIADLLTAAFLICYIVISVAKYSNYLKVHKREIFYGSKFEIFTFS